MADNQTIKSPKAVAVVAAKMDGGVVSIFFKAEGGGMMELRLIPEIVATLATGLLGLLGKIGAQPDVTGITGQPITVTAARAAVGPERQPILDLTIESGGHLPITFPRTAIQPLQTALAELFELSKPANKGH